MPGDAEKIMEAGFNHYLAKPINLNAFNQLLADLQLS
jgi:CheY-like chemotaxis protein